MQSSNSLAWNRMLVRLSMAILVLSVWASGVAAAPASPAGLSVTISGLAGGPFTLTESDAKPLDNYNGPGFTMRNLVATAPGLPLTIYFRPDINSARREVVFEYKALITATPNPTPPPGLPPYTVTISDNGTALATIAIPVSHQAGKRWRWQSTRRPIIAKPAELVASGAVLPYDASLIPNIGELKPNHPAYAPLQLAGVSPHMGMTGERDDIGPLPSAAAYYLATGDAAALGAVLEWGEASGSIPWHWRDPNGLGPIDLDITPDAGGNSTLKIYGSPNDDVAIDDAHQPSLGYLPFLLTGDPYYLEELQFQASWTMTAYNGSYGINGPGILWPVQTRGYAWGLRNLIQAVIATPESVPSWLLPRSYWRRKLENNRKFFDANFMDSYNPTIRALHLAGAIEYDGNLPFWQQDFLQSSLELAVRAGLTEWAAERDWHGRQVIDRTSGKSGWPRKLPTPYEAAFRTLPANMPAADWKTAAEANKLTADPQDGLDPSEDPAYATYAWGILNLRVGDGDSDAAAARAWLDRVLPRKNFYMLKWAFGTKLPSKTPSFAKPEADPMPWLDIATPPDTTTLTAPRPFIRATGHGADTLRVPDQMPILMQFGNGVVVGWGHFRWTAKGFATLIDDSGASISIAQGASPMHPPLYTPPPSPNASPEGASVPPAAQVTDIQGNVFTLDPDAGGDRGIQINGKESGGRGLRLAVHDGVVYTQNSGKSWYSWTRGQWSSAAAPDAPAH